MAASTITRTTWTNDDGTGTTGTILNNAELQLIYDKIDLLFSASGTRTFENGLNGDQCLLVTNTTSNTAATARYKLLAFATDVQLIALSAGYATSAFAVAGGGLLYAASAGGFSIAAVDAAGDLRFYAGGSSEVARMDSTQFFWGDTSNVNNLKGFTINQGDADDEAFALKSSDVAHGVTSFAETDTYFTIQKVSATAGGARVAGLSETSSPGVDLWGVVTTAVATRSGADLAAVIIDGALKSGTTTASLGVNGNILAVRDNATARFFLDADGDSHQDVGTAWTNFDDGDDLARLQAVAVTLARPGDPLRREFLRSFRRHRRVLAQMPGKPLIAFNRDGHHFANMSRITMLHTGALRQLGTRLVAADRRIQQLERTVKRLAA